ncbi:hypothetical protein Hanom_Chr15g01381821 [Helianthus anomalus]
MFDFIAKVLLKDDENMDGGEEAYTILGGILSWRRGTIHDGYIRLVSLKHQSANQQNLKLRCRVLLKSYLLTSLGSLMPMRFSLPFIIVIDNVIMITLLFYVWTCVHVIIVLV